jgi:tRNA threonylcarbamoyladenosine biosynthesis protein TsaE
MTVVAAGGVTGRLVAHGLWGELREVEGDPDARWVQEALARAADSGALDLRVGSDPDGCWRALGFAPLDPAGPELLLPVPQLLDGAERTRALGARLAAVLQPGDLVVLSGPLGAGKTALTQGIGAGLGVRGAVTSPTFVLARTHRGPVPLVHVDAYRLRDPDEDASWPGAAALADLDLEAALEDAVVVVEWGEGLVEELAEARLHVDLGRPAGNDGSVANDRRIARVRAHGSRWALR